MRKIAGKVAYTTPEAAEYLGDVAAGTLRYWRHIGYGPKSFKVGKKLVHYFEEDLDAFINDLYTDAS